MVNETPISLILRNREKKKNKTNFGLVLGERFILSSYVFTFISCRIVIRTDARTTIYCQHESVVAIALINFFVSQTTCVNTDLVTAAIVKTASTRIYRTKEIESMRQL